MSLVIYKPEYKTRKAGNRLPDSMFKELPQDEYSLHLMTMFLIYGKRTDSGYLTRISKQYNKKQAELKKQLNSLAVSGHLIWQSYWIYSADFDLNYNLALPLSQYIFDRHPEWYATELEYSKSQVGTDVFFWNVTAALYDQDIDHLKRERSMFQWRDEQKEGLLRCFTDSYYQPMLFTLSETLLQNLTAKFLDKQLYAEKLDLTELERIDSIISDYKQIAPKADYQQYDEQKEAYRYFINLTPPSPVKKSSTIWAYISNAIFNLRAGDIAGAGELFETALKLHNKQSDDKNLFYNPIAGYFLMLCYARQNNSKSEKKVSQYLRKDISGSLIQAPAYIVAQYVIVAKNKRNLKRYIGDCLEADVSLLRVFGNIFRLFFDVDVKNSISVPQTNLAILREEPVLKSISIREPWEKVLDELISDVSATSQETPQLQEKTERLIYVIDGGIRSRYIELYRQRWLKSGRWSAPARVTPHSFVRKEIACMDQKDIQIANHIKGLGYGYYDYCQDIETYLPLLVGSDRVFTEVAGEYMPVSIRAEKAYLNIERKKNRLDFSSNVKLKKDNELLIPCIVEESPTSYYIVELSAYSKKVLATLLTLGSVPDRAETQLKAFVDAVGNNLEIHSDIIEGGSTLEQIEGDSTIILRITPKKDEFLVEPLVQPLAGGKLCFTPALGKQVIYDERENVRYQVQRNIMLEKQRFVALDSALDSAGILLQEGHNLLSAADLLALMEATEGREEYALEWLDNAKIQLKQPAATNSYSLGLHTKENWFEVEGELQIDEATVLAAADLLRLMQTSMVGKRYIRLSDNEFLALNEELTKQLQHISQLAQFTSKKARIPRYEVGLLGGLLQDKSSILKADKGVRGLLKKIEEAQAMQVSLPKGLQATLRDYQIEGYEWMSRLAAWGAGACLADDMGLGKTIQTIALMLSRAQKGASLVVAPASVLYNWQTELGRFAPSLNVGILNEAADRTQMIADAKEYDIILTTYGLLVREEDSLTSKHWNVVCLDEAHTIKNRATKMSAAAMNLDSDMRIALTGTPLQNYLSELWNLFQFINPGLLGSYETFSHDFITPIEVNNDKTRRRVLRQILQPFLLRRTKAEVIDELPDKTEITRRVALGSDERVQYEAMRIAAQKQIETASKVDMNVLASITRLRQAACSVDLVEGHSLNSESSKLADLRSLVAQIIEGGNRVLIFSQFTSFLRMAEKVVNELSKDNALYLDGSTPLPKRKQMVEQFQRGERQVFLISLKAGGLGLNLTAANYVIHLDPWWNPAIEQQATDRAYRIGQHQNVTVYHLIAADTIEEKILRLHKTKRDLADALLQDQNTTHALSLNDLKELVAISKE